ncbi:MAG TPA: hypothetical protein VJT09_18745 [Pyrinomonadaceae bacterium]|nr:hypothetical protein [Pyrinomonadaceae bacterium]
MAVEQISLHIGGRRAPASHLWLGTLGMIGAPMLFLTSLAVPFVLTGEVMNARVLSVLGIIYLAGWAASVIGMRRLRVTGDHLLARIIFPIQLAGLILALSLNVQEIINPELDTNTLLFRVTDAAWPLSHLFMLVVFVLVLTAKVWKGWRKLTPLFCGLALPLFFGLSAIVPRTVAGLCFGAATAVSFMLLGYAVRTGGRELS